MDIYLEVPFMGLHDNGMIMCEINVSVVIPSGQYIE